MPYQDATPREIDEAMESSWQAFKVIRQTTLKERARFLHAIASELDKKRDHLISAASRESNLTEARLLVEFKRTLFQLTSYAEACVEGAWLDIRIDKGRPDRNPPRPDLRKMLVPIGPVVVFGASNFPFAYSTAGGDTACALAAGCPVVIKAHPAHSDTSQAVADCVREVARLCGLPEGVFHHLNGSSFEVGKALVLHERTKAVAFTGSYEGGKAIFDLANGRRVPIPVFAEMGSVNPVFLLPGKLRENPGRSALMYASSITQSVGQFCTNPGLMIGIEGGELDEFMAVLGQKIEEEPPARMLHGGIAKSFRQKREQILTAAGVEMVSTSTTGSQEGESIPTIARAPASAFLQNPLLHQEVFGPFSLVVVCRDLEEMQQVAASLEGQLTCSLLATDEEVEQNPDLVMTLRETCGRLVLNGVPTGVEVALAMHHGGPFPATTDSRFTAVGADGIRRFARPVCYQNWSNHLLPEELKDENPLGLPRSVA
jgi:alpha-ketoglutaric semialdehyde dehydrogenase